MIWLAAAVLGLVHTLETIPYIRSAGIEVGVHFRVRLSVAGGVVERNGSLPSATRLRVIRAIEDSGLQHYCNDSESALLSDGVLAEVGDLSSKGEGNDTDAPVSSDWQAADGYATFVAPPYAFKLCYMNPNYSSSWLVPDSDADATNGDIYNVTKPRLTWTSITGDYTAGTYTAIRVDGTQLNVTGHVLYSDVFKIVADGKLCTEEGKGYYQSGDRFEGSLTTHAETGSLSYYLGTRDAVRAPEGLYTSLYARVKLPAAGLYGICYSSEYHDRYYPGVPGWRFLASASSAFAATSATLTVYDRTSEGALTWALADVTQHSFAFLSVLSTESDLRRAPSEGTFTSPLSSKGDQLRMLGISLFEGTAHTGCWSEIPVAAQNYSFTLGPASSTFMFPNPALLSGSLLQTVLTTPFSATASDAWAEVRLPDKGDYIVCYRRPGKNWVQLAPTLTTAEQYVNITWYLNDTTGGSEGPLRIGSSAPVLNMLPLEPSSPSEGSVAVRLVLPDESCASAEPVVQVWDAGGKEVPYPVQRTWDSDDPAATDAVYAYLVLPAVEVEYRVCVKHGTHNWWSVPSDSGSTTLLVSPPNGLRADISDRRAETLGAVHLQSPTSQLDARPATPFGGSWSHGTMVRVVPNTTLCTVTFPDLYWNNTCTDLSKETTEPALVHVPTDEPEVSAAAAHIQLPQVGSYKLCVKEGVHNWVALYSFDVIANTEYQLSASEFLSGTVAEIVIRSNEGVLSHSTAAKLVPVGVQCDMQHIGRSYSLPTIADPSTDKRATLRLPIEATVQPTTRQADLCISAGGESWTLFPLVTLLPSHMAYAAQGIAIQHAELAIAVITPGYSNTELDSLVLVPAAHHCDRYDVPQGLYAVLGPSRESGLSVMVGRFAIPQGTVRYRVCYRLRDQWLELAEAPLGSAPLSLDNIHLTGDNLTSVAVSYLLTGGTAPDGYLGDEHTVLAGSESVFRVVGGAEGGRAKISAACTTRGEEQLVYCAGAPCVLHVNMSIPLVSGVYRKCLLSPSLQWVDVGPVTVAASLFTAELTPSRLAVYDGSIGANGLPSPTLLTGNEYVKVVALSDTCSSRGKVFTRDDAANDLLGLVCFAGTEDCKHTLATNALRMQGVEGSLKACLWRTFSYGGRVPSSTLVAVPLMNYNVGTEKVKLAWHNGDPTAGYNASWLLKRTDLLHVGVMAVWPDGVRAYVDSTLSVVLTQSNRTATLAVHSECNNMEAPDYGWSVYNTHARLAAGVAQFDVRIHEDCLAGCELTVRYKHASITTTFFSEFTAVTGLELDPPRSVLNEAPLLSADGKWLEVVIVAHDSQHSTVTGSRSLVRIAPDAALLGNGTFRCREQATQAACGAIPSPGPFSVTLAMNGSITIEVGTTGRLAGTGVLPVAIYLSTNPTVAKTLSLRWRHLDVANVTMTELSRTSVTASRTPVAQWSPFLPSSSVVGLAGSYLIAGVPYLSKFRGVGAQGELATLSDLLALAPAPVLRLRLFEGSSEISTQDVALPAATSVWSPTLTFPRCGNYTTGGIFEPCLLVFELVNLLSQSVAVKGTMTFWVREVATALRVVDSSSHINTPLGNVFTSIGDSGKRDWWYRGYAMVLPRGGWEGAQLSNEQEPAIYAISNGAVQTGNLFVSGPCIECGIEASSPLLGLGRGVVSTAPDVVGVVGTVGSSYIIAGVLVAITLQSVGLGGAPTQSDTATMVPFLEGAPQGSLVVHSNTTATMKYSVAVFLVEFTAACASCKLSFSTAGSPAWASPPPPTVWETDIDVHLFPVATTLKSRVYSNALQTGPDTFVLNGVAVLAVEAIDEAASMVDPAVRSSVELVNPQGLGVQLLAESLDRGQVYIRVSIPTTCVACTFRVIVGSLGELTLSVTVPAQPTSLHLRTSVDVAYPYRGPLFPESRAVHIVLSFYEALTPAAHPGPFDISVRSDTCLQVFACSGCKVSSPAAVHEVAIVITGSVGNITCDVALSVGALVNTTRVRWLPQKPSMRLQVFDMAPYGGEGWLVRSGEHVVNGPLHNWSYSVPGSVFTGHAFPLWVEMVDNDSLPVAGARGTVSLEVASHSGCGDPSLTYYGAVLPEVHLPLANATRQVTQNYPAPVVDGRALFIVTFEGGCQHCVLKAHYSSRSIIVPHPTGYSQPIEVRTLAAEEAAFIGSSRAVQRAVNESANATLYAVTCRQGLCYHYTRASGQLTASYKNTDQVHEAMYNATIFMRSGVGSMVAVFTAPCVACKALVEPSLGLALLGTATPWVYHVKAVFHKVVAVTPFIEGRAHETFALTVAAVDMGGNLVSDYSAVTQLSRAEGGGAGDGGILYWTNAAYLGRENMTYQQEGYPLWAGRWTEGTQVWVLYFSTACTWCLLTVAGLQHTAVIHARAERLQIDNLETALVLVQEVVTFRVAVIDNEGLIDKSFGSTVAMYLEVALEGEGGASLATVPVHKVENGIAWVTTAFSTPLQLGQLVVDMKASNLTNRVARDTLLVATPATVRYTPPVLTVGTVGRELRLVGGDVVAAVRKPVALTLGVTDSSPDLNIAYTTPPLVVRITADCGVPVSAPAQVAVVNGTAQVSLVIESLPPGGVCKVQFDAPRGSLVSTQLYVAVEIRPVTCSQLTLSNFPELVLAGALNLLVVACTDDTGHTDTAQQGMVELISNCTELREAPMTEGDLVFRITLPPAVCLLTVVWESLNSSLLVTAQQPARLALLNTVPDTLAVNTPTGVEVALYDTEGRIVRGASHQLEVSVVQNGSQHVAWVLPCVPHSEGQWKGMWGCWLLVLSLFQKNIQLEFSAGGLRTVTQPLLTTVTAMRLSLDGVAPPMYRVSQRSVRINVIATDSAYVHATGSTALVRLRQVDDVNYQPFISQSSLWSEDPLAQRLQGGAVSYNVFWKGGDGQVLLSVLGMGYDLVQLPPIVLVMQTVARYVISTSAVASFPREREAFEVQLLVVDGAGNTVLGDNETFITVLWQSNEYTQRVYASVEQGKTSMGIFTTTLVYDRPSVNTTVGLEVSGPLEKRIVWSQPFTIMKYTGPGVVLPFTPPLLSFTCGACTFWGFNATVVEHALGMLTSSPVVMTGVCTADRANCTMLNRTDVYLRPAALLASGGAIVEFTFSNTESELVWDDTSLLEDALANRSSQVYTLLQPSTGLTVVGHPGSERPAPEVTPTAIAPLGENFSPFDGAVADGPCYLLIVGVLTLY